MSGVGFEDPVGQICLDFANTRGNRLEAAGDRLCSYMDLVEWAGQAGLLADDQKVEMCEKAQRLPSSAAATLQRALSLREGIYTCCVRLAKRQMLRKGDLAEINRELAIALPNQRLRAEKSGCGWYWAGRDDALDRMLWPVALAAAGVLTGDASQRLRQCASVTCSWLFFDSSRNRRRRWCDMASCGNRAKARRYYARHRG